MSASVERIRSWLNTLADATASGSEPVSAERIATMAAMLESDRYPEGAFTFASAKHLAGKHRFFPSYAELTDTLHAWRLANLPGMPMLAGPDGGEPLDPTDRTWVTFWHKRRAEIWASNATFQRGSREADMANLASLVRQQSPRAWALISRPQPTAAERTREWMSA